MSSAPTRVMYVAIAHHDASPVFRTKEQAKKWINERNPTYGKLLYKVEEWHLTDTDLNQLDLYIEKPE